MYRIDKIINNFLVGRKFMPETVKIYMMLADHSEKAKKEHTIAKQQEIRNILPGRTRQSLFSA